MKTAIPRELALAAFRKHLEVHSNFDHYAGIVTLHGLTRLAAETDDPALISEARKQLMPYVKGERSFRNNFPNYLCGGNATAYLFCIGRLPEAAETVRHYAEQILKEAPRDPQGILCHPTKPGNRVWIDVAFAVTPFLLYAGLGFKEERYIEEAFQQTAKMVKLFRSPETGLLFQSRGVNGADRFSEDHWSRGNGWGAYGLTELACSLPKDHPRKPEALQLYHDHIDACARAQDENGLWHQEMTAPLSYVETSGTGLLLYALGSGIHAGLLGFEHRTRFEKGLGNLLEYISSDTDIYHTCRGCLCPGQGRKIDYMAHPPVPNDVHAFGPVVLAMGLAHIMGIRQVANTITHIKH